MAHTLFAAVTEVRGQVAAIGSVDQSLVERIDAIAVKVDALSDQLERLSQALATATNGLAQTLLNVQSVIGAPGDET